MGAFLLWLLATLCLATLTLWIPGYWPVAAFEISILVLAAVMMFRPSKASAATAVPVYVFSFVALWGCLQMVTGSTVHRFATERAICQWITWAALYYAAVRLLPGQVSRVRGWLVWFSVALAVEAILQAYLSPGIAYGLFPTGYQQYVMGPIVYHSHYAVFIECMLPLALMQAFAERSREYLLGAAVLLASLVVSASRAGLVLAGVEVIAMMLLLQSRKPALRRRQMGRLLALAALTAVLAAIVGYQTMAQRFATEALLDGRLQFARSTLHMIAEHPWMGWGLDAWPAVYPAFATFDAGAVVNQAHTDWLQWTAEGGLPVGLALLMLAVWAVRPAVRSVWGIGVLAVLVHALFDYPFSRPAVGGWWILILAMTVVAERQPRSIPD